MSSSNKLEMAFNFRVVSWGLEVYLEVFHALLTIPHSYHPFPSPSENFTFTRPGPEPELDNSGDERDETIH